LTYKQVLAAPREQFGSEFLDHMFFFHDPFDIHINNYLLTLNSLKQHFPQTLLPNMWPQIVALPMPCILLCHNWQVSWLHRHQSREMFSSMTACIATIQCKLLGLGNRQCMQVKL
jgi:hypothetical protein